MRDNPRDRRLEPPLGQASARRGDMSVEEAIHDPALLGERGESWSATRPFPREAPERRDERRQIDLPER